MTKIQSIRQEYGEPFRDVVRGFAIAGNSKTLTAKVLGMDIHHFYDCCTSYGLHQYFKPQAEMNELCRGGWQKGRSRGKLKHEHRRKISEAMKKKKEGR
jgi:hypothetical protein